MSRLFDTTTINGMVLKNRFIRSATWEGLARDDGSCTPELIQRMTQLAAGGVGLIISGHAYVEPRGKAGRRQLGLYDDHLIPGLTRMTEAVHQKGGRIVAQLNHAGMFADPEMTGQKPIGPSDGTGLTRHQTDEMTDRDIQGIVRAFALSAKRAQNAGFDGIQIHAAHGYLLSQFLSPLFNKRQDRYGGDIEKRSNLLLEVLKEIRAQVGSDYPVLIKMNTQDFLDGGLELEDAIRAAKILEQNSMDAIELSGGTLLSGRHSPTRKGILKETDEAYFRDDALSFRKKIHIPLILVGGIRSFHVAEQIVNENVVDYVSMCRPFIREPGLIERWKSGDREKAICISDNRCYGPLLSGEGVRCITEK